MNIRHLLLILYVRVYISQAGNRIRIRKLLPQERLTYMSIKISIFNSIYTVLNNPFPPAGADQFLKLLS